jgi:hypothetical protein
MIPSDWRATAADTAAASDLGAKMRFHREVIGLKPDDTEALIKYQFRGGTRLQQ